MSTLEHPISILGVPREYPSCRCTRARTAAAGESSPECGYPRSTPWLRVPCEYPVSTRYVLPYSECAQHCRALPTHYPTNTTASTRSTFAAAVSTPCEHPWLSTLVRVPFEYPQRAAPLHARPPSARAAVRRAGIIRVHMCVYIHACVHNACVSIIRPFVLLDPPPASTAQPTRVSASARERRTGGGGGAQQL